MSKIKHKVFFAVGTVVIVFILALIILLSTTYNSYVKMIKKNEILKVYNLINKASVEELLSSEFISDVEYKHNLRLNIRNPADTDATPEAPRMPPFKNFMRNNDFQLMRFKNILGDNKFVFMTPQDRATDFTAISFVGVFDNGFYMMCQVPISFIDENIKYTISFICYAGIVALILCVLISYFIAKKITNPIIEISKVTEKIAQLDFNEKCSYKSTDELGVLSDNVNFLSSRLESNITSLKAEIEKVKKVDEMRKNLIINVSHELKTPIFLIQSYAEGLKQNVNDNEQDKNYYCDVIADESVKMDDIVKELLNLARIESGKVELEMTSFNLKEIVTHILKNCSISLENISINETVENINIRADKQMAERVIINFVTNAIDHTPLGGSIKIYNEIVDHKLRLYVYNSGLNIPIEDMEKIWQSFYKVDKSRSRSYGGTGIGLSIVKAIMDSHKNKYGVRNEDDGITFFADFDLTV